MEDNYKLLSLLALVGCVAGLSGNTNDINALYKTIFSLDFDAIGADAAFNVATLYDVAQGTITLYRSGIDAAHEVLRVGDFTEDDTRNPIPDLLTPEQLDAADLLSLKSFYVTGRIGGSDLSVSNFGVLAQVTVTIRKDGSESISITFLEHASIGTLVNDISSLRDASEAAFAQSSRSLLSTNEFSCSGSSGEKSATASESVPSTATTLMRSTSCIQTCAEDRLDKRSSCLSTRQSAYAECKKNLHLCAYAGCDVALAAALVGCILSGPFYPICAGTAAAVAATCNGLCVRTYNKCNGAASSGYTSCLENTDEQLEGCVIDRCGESARCPLVGGYYQSPGQRSIAGVSSYQQCQDKCQAASDCLGWTWRSGNHGAQPNSCVIHRDIRGAINYDSIFPARPTEGTCNAIPTSKMSTNYAAVLDDDMNSRISFDESELPKYIDITFASPTKVCALGIVTDYHAKLPSGRIAYSTAGGNFGTSGSNFAVARQYETTRSGKGPPNPPMLIDENVFDMPDLAPLQKLRIFIDEAKQFPVHIMELKVWSSPPSGAVHYSCPTSFCHDPADAANDCLYHGGYPRGAAVADIPNVASTDACQSLCQANAECQTYTYRSSRHRTLPNSCVLKPSSTSLVMDNTGFPLGDLMHYGCSSRDCIRGIGQLEE